MNVPVANIVVSFDKEAINRLFSKGATFQNLIKGISNEKDVLLFNHEANPNFLNFKHEFGGGAKGNVMTLGLLDPTGDFEQRFILDNTVQNVAGYLARANKKKEKSPLTEVRKTLSLEDSQLSEQENRVRAVVASRDLTSDFQKAYQEAKGDKHLYVAYGIGNNLDLWSGPHDMTLIGASMAVEGARKITLKLASTPLTFNTDGRRGMFGEKVNLNLEGLSMEVDARSNNFDFENIGSGELIYGADTKRKVQQTDFSNNLESEESALFELLSTQGLENARLLTRNVDFHLVVTDVIRKLIKAATGNPNVIILLPDINLVCREAIEEVGSLFRVTESIGDRNYTAINGRMQQGELDNYGPNVYTGKIFNAVKALCERFSLHFSSELIDATLRTKTYSSPNVQWYEEQEESTSFNDRVAKFIRDRMFFATMTLRSGKGIPEYQEGLDRIIADIKRCSSDSYSPKTDFYYESDAKLIAFWSDEKYKNLPLFGGAGNAIDPNHSVIIFGDTQLIRNYLYGSADIESKDKGTVSENDSVGKSIELTPLHPFDKIVLTDQKYNKEIKALSFPVVNRDGSFGDISYIPDDFSFIDESLSKEVKNLIREKAIPVFRYNTTNPNVFSMNFNWAPIYFAQLRLGVTKEIDRKAAATLAGVIEDRYANFEFADINSVITYIRLRHRILGNGDETEQQIKKEVAHRFLGQDRSLMAGEAEEEANNAYVMYLNMLNDPDKPMIKIDQLLPGDPITVMANFNEQMYRNSMRMSIETLPMFHVSKHMGTLNSPCLVFAQDQSVSQTLQPKRSALNSFYSGEYSILGFSHKIDDSGATSSFTLVKSIPNILLQAEESDSLEIEGGSQIG